MGHKFLSDRIQEKMKKNIKRNQILSSCKQVIQETVPDATIILYGSFARGESHKDSDIDLLVLIKGGLDYKLTQRIRHRLFDIELKEGIIISCIVRSEGEWESRKYMALPFKQAVDDEGIII